MGPVILDNLVSAIDALGVATQRARPGQKAAIITRPVAAVSMHSADVHANTITVVVTVLSPMDLGAQTCEDAALMVATLMYDNLRSEVCTVGSCACDERAGVFSIDIKAVLPLIMGE